MSRGFEESDIKQLCYIAFEKTFETYATDKQYLYSTALGYAMHDTIRQYIGKSTDVLNKKNESFDMVIDDDDGRTVAEIIPDPSAVEQFDRIETSAELSQVRNTINIALNRLPEEEKNVIIGYYFQRKSLVKLAELMGIDYKTIRGIHAKGLKRLQSPYIRHRLLDDLGRGSERYYKHVHVDIIATDRIYYESIGIPGTLEDIRRGHI